MGQNQDTRVFNGVMDQDSAPFTIDSANVRYRLNLVNLYNDNGFASNENIQGFEMVSNSYLSTSRNKCIGAFEDVRGNSIIYFVWAEDATHGIYRWYQNKGGLNGQLEKVYQGSVLGFEEYHRISHCSLVDELLIYTDGYGSPKSLNIGRMNQTNKRKIFNIYFDQAAFLLPTTYTLELYIGTGYIFTWTSAATDYIGRVDDFILATQADVVLNTYCKAESRVNYAQVTLNEVGDYMINVSPSAFVVAENFYPDVTPTPVSYASMNGELITAIKYPPFKAPNVKYGQSNSLGGFNISYYSSQAFLGSPSKDTSLTIGVSNDSTGGFYDTGNFVVLGNTTTGTANHGSPVVPLVPTPLGYITNPLAQDIVVNVDFQINVNVTSGLPPRSLRVLFGKYVNTATLPIDRELYYNTSILVPSNFNITKSVSVVIAPGEQWILYTFSQCLGFTISATARGSVSYRGDTNPLSSNFYQFRARYVYKDNQESVLGAISTIPLPISQNQDIIELDFTDDRLASVEKSSDIINVILSVSSDNGTTWYDFKKLYPWEYTGVGRQVSFFSGREVLIPVDTAKAILPYHNIPITARSQEFIDDRIFYGAVVSGYDSFVADFATEVVYADDTDPVVVNIKSASPPISASYFKRGWKGRLGIVYYDAADRKTGVCIPKNNANVEVKYYDEDVISGVPSLNPAYLRCSIKSEPPSWATKYQIVRTLDLSQSQYLMFVTDNLEYRDKNDQPTSAPTAAYIVISVANIAVYTDKSNINSKINFPFVNGDRVRFIIDKAGAFYDKNDFEILKVDGTDIYIKYDGSIVLPSVPSGSQLIEFYSPKGINENAFYYEFSECYPIEEATFYGVKKKYHVGSSSNQSYNSFGLTGTDAVVDLLNGDVFYRNRVMPWNTVSFTTNPPEKTYLISSNTTSDFTSDISTNNGRVNSTELLGQVYQPTGVVFTNRYISGTKINGLNAVEAANTRQYSTIYGDLNKMQVVNNDVLKFIFGNGYQLSIYVNQGVIRQSGGANNLISIYDDVAGNSHLIQRTLGTQNAESVVLNDEGDVFGWDETEGVVWLSASNATQQVSDNNMMNTFNAYALHRRKLDTSKSNAPCIYNLSQDLMTITLAPLQARQFIAPTATVKLADLDSLGWNIQVIVQPQGLTKTYTTPPSVSWYDIVRDALPTTYGMVQNADGSFNVLAPDYTNYKDSVLILSGTSLSTGVTTTINYSFTGGQEASNEPPFSGVTLAYSRKLKGWVTYFSFLPEMYGRLRNQVSSFKDGQLWLHDKSVLSNNFYGTQYPSLLRFVLNKDYPKVKVPLSVWYRGLGSWGSVVRYQPDNMETEMIPAAFRLQENGYAASVTRDRNDPRFTDPQQAWVNGQEVRGDAVEIELYNNDSSQARIDSEKTVYLHSNLS